MATPGKAPFAGWLGQASSRSTFETATLLRTILQAGFSSSDLIFSPGRTPQVEAEGKLLTPEPVAGMVLSADDTRRIAVELIGDNKQAVAAFREQGYCDVSYALPGFARFRANIFIQRGSCAIVLRVIPTAIPTFQGLGLPNELAEVASLSDGIVLVIGPRGSGKSSTLAALLDRINEERACHVITLEDPIEFLHNHKRSTIHQRELHSDIPSFAQGLRAALRQAPNVIFISEIREHDTIELAVQAAETGHLVLCSLNAVDAAKGLDRLVSFYSVSEQSAFRGRLARTVRFMIWQQRRPSLDGAKSVSIGFVKPRETDFFS
jgi:twitching motility protein PilT